MTPAEPPRTNYYNARVNADKYSTIYSSNSRPTQPFYVQIIVPIGVDLQKSIRTPLSFALPTIQFHGCCNGCGGGRGSVLVHSQSVCMRPSSQSSSSSTSAFTNPVRIHHSALAASARSCSNKIDFPVQQQHCFVFVLVVCLSVCLSRKTERPSSFHTLTTPSSQCVFG